MAKGLVSIKPRVGTVVNDYRREGSLALLTSLVNYHGAHLDPRLIESMLQMRMLVEVETARLAAKHRSAEHLKSFDRIVKQEAEVEVGDAVEIVELDFSFHHLIALATENLIYPLLINSYKQVYTSLSRLFFSDPAVVPVVFDLHLKIVGAIEARDEKKAVRIMKRILAHGEEHMWARLKA